MVKGRRGKMVERRRKAKEAERVKNANKKKLNKLYIRTLKAEIVYFLYFLIIFLRHYETMTFL